MSQIVDESTNDVVVTSDLSIDIAVDIWLPHDQVMIRCCVYLLDKSSSHGIYKTTLSSS